MPHMRWLFRKLDSLVAAMFAALGGIAASQFLAFLQQYRQRLGGRLEEAEANYLLIRDGTLYRAVDESTRAQLAEAAQARVEVLATAYDAIDAADPFAKPFVFLRHIDGEIARTAFAAFQPALPLDPVSLAYGGAGLGLTWIVYELLKAPVALAIAGRRGGRDKKGRGNGPGP